jgi:hypothetical protein
MPAGGKRHGAGRPKGSRALTLLAPTGERMSFYEAARQYDKKALQTVNRAIWSGGFAAYPFL